MPGSAENPRDHAVVIGASIAGLSAARVLSDFFVRVTVFERDDLPGTPANRATVPQDRHLHLLMARGAIEFESLFPGLLKDMVAAGVPMLDNRPDGIYLGAAGHVLGTGHRLRREFTAYVPSRPHLEWQLRKRVQDIDNVEIVRRSVWQPRFDRARRRVTGVLLDSGECPDLREHRPRGRRGRPWHPAAGVVDAVGISAPSRRDHGHRHQLRQPPVPHPGGPDPGEGRGRRRLPRSVAGAGHAVLRGRHLGADHLRGGKRQAADDFSRDAGAGRRAAAGSFHRRAGSRPNPSATRHSTPFRPASGAATTNSTASPPGSSRSAMR